MIGEEKKPDPPEKYAAEAEVPMHLLDERLVRKMLRNAYQAGMIAGLQEVAEKLEKAEWVRDLHKSPFC